MRRLAPEILMLMNINTGGSAMSVSSLRFPLLVACLFAAGGCLPAAWTETPRLTGNVVTSEGRPVANATVTVTEVSDHLGRHAGQFEMRTDTAGHFFHAEQTRWQLLPIVL
jgi:hypothetical protein